MRLCGRDDCQLWKKIGRNVRTPHVKVYNHNLRDEMIRWMLPVVYPVDLDHFLSASEARITGEKINLTLDKLLTFLPFIKDNYEEIKSKMLKNRYRSFFFR